VARHSERSTSEAAKALIRIAAEFGEGLGARLDARKPAA
jgi:hypothetical protein